MYNVLVINAGSSSVKYQLIDMDTKKVLAKGLAERVGLEMGYISHKTDSVSKKFELPLPTHLVAIKQILSYLTDKEIGCISDIKEISAVGHRVAHGRTDFKASALLDDEAIKRIEANCELAPLHVPANLMGIRACMEAMPGVPQVGGFDTTFHQTMPERAYLYAIPYEYYTDYNIRRYGFHGLSHFYVSRRYGQLTGKDIKNLKIITCHLGNGASISAVKNGESIENSMGFTPNEGLIMGTRSGDIDTGILPYLCSKLNIDAEEAMNIFNKKSGMLGVSGISNDFRDIHSAAAEGNHRAQIALELFVYNLKKYIGSYAAAMNGVDAVIFTGGIGENDDITRRLVCEDMSFFGIEIDDKKNDGCREERRISKDNARVDIYVIPTDEEMVIAEDTQRIATALRK